LAYLTSFFALAFHNGLEDCNTNGCINTEDDSCTPDRNLVSFGPVTLDIMVLDCVILGAYWRRG